MSLKRQKLLLIVGGIGAFGGIVALVATRPWHRPSPEMAHLRSVEKQLSLPLAKGRSEEDAGQYTDDKGAPHYSRNILRYYDDKRKVDEVEKIVVQQGWGRVLVSGYGSSTSHYFINRNNQTCVSTLVDETSTDRLPHAVFISAAKDDSCKDYIK